MASVRLHTLVCFSIALVACEASTITSIIREASGNMQDTATFKVGDAATSDENIMVQEGDMLFPKWTDSDDISSFKVHKVDAYRWPDATIPFHIQPGFSSEDLHEIKMAMEEWMRHTCVKFVPRSTEEHYIELNGVGGCSSFVGYHREPSQMVTLGDGCRNQRTIVHELGHAIGLYHEQSRVDRDKHIIVEERNTHAGMEYNMRIDDNAIDLGVEYDFTSIMHYDQWGFTYNRKPTMIAYDPRWQDLMGHAEGLAFSDIKQVNLMYKCDARCDTSEPCPDGGYRNELCECMCRGNPEQPCAEPTVTSPLDAAADKQWREEPECKGDWPDWSCEPYVAEGSCQNPYHGAFMQSQCADSCGCCYDASKACPYWRALGYCKSQIHGDFMRIRCASSCGICEGGFDATANDPFACEDDSPKSYCERRKENGMCDQVAKSCPKTCGKCNGECIDDNERPGICEWLVLTDKCKERPIYAKLKCAKSCNMC